ncbi:hypothetical protein T492DRAFT_843786 [Pavlovales sp. CCMP2436]|nr:hypothetical protein T492DRAFT_843786 [Pavlovales sp. CCMP2436]
MCLVDVNTLTPTLRALPTCAAPSSRTRIVLQHSSGGAGELPDLKKPRGEHSRGLCGSLASSFGDASKALILRSVLLDCVEENGADDNAAALAAEKPTLPDDLARVTCAMFSPEMTIEMDRAFIGNTRAEVDQGMQKKVLNGPLHLVLKNKDIQFTDPPGWAQDAALGISKRPDPNKGIGEYTMARIKQEFSKCRSQMGQHESNWIV